MIYLLLLIVLVLFGFAMFANNEKYPYKKMYEAEKDKNREMQKTLRLIASNQVGLPVTEAQLCLEEVERIESNGSKRSR